MIKFLLKLYYHLFPFEMVQWWKTKDAVRAKLTTAQDGSYVMWMEGEKYAFPGYPRGHLIVNRDGGYSPYSRLKHLIKTRLFNENWHRLDRGEPIDMDCTPVYEMAETLKYDVMPIEKCAPAVRAIHKALVHPTWQNILTLILQEDDAYRFRFQWIVPHLSKRDPIGSFDRAMELLEHAETTEDMKDRVRLIRRVLLELWKDPRYAAYWIDFVEKLDFKQAKLSKADKYFFRAKYFKVDYQDPNTYLGRISNEILY